MKATVVQFSMLLSLAACGTTTQSTIANAHSHSAAQAEADDNADVIPALSDDSLSAFTTAYASLDSSVITAVITPDFDADALFVDVDVSTPIRSVSFGHKTTVRVPAGVKGAPVDPNLATSFYVVYGASTNRKGGTYGPFVITENGLGMAQTQVLAVIAAARALDETDFSCDTEVDSLPVDGLFAQIDATPAHRSRSFGHTITLYVPAGTVDEPADPDLATTYYVQIGDSTNVVGGTFGPFTL